MYWAEEEVLGRTKDYVVKASMGYKNVKGVTCQVPLSLISLSLPRSMPTVSNKQAIKQPFYSSKVLVISGCAEIITEKRLRISLPKEGKFSEINFSLWQKRRNGKAFAIIRRWCLISLAKKSQLRFNFNFGSTTIRCTPTYFIYCWLQLLQQTVCSKLDYIGRKK